VFERVSTFRFTERSTFIDHPIVPAALFIVYTDNGGKCSVYCRERSRLKVDKPHHYGIIKAKSFTVKNEGVSRSGKQEVSKVKYIYLLPFLFSAG
jgi:hypothetical protein